MITVTFYSGLRRKGELRFGTFEGFEEFMRHAPGNVGGFDRYEVRVRVSAK